MELVKEIDMINITVQLIIALCVCALFLSVLLDFMIYSRKDKVKKEKKSIVETGTMTAFFIVFYGILVSRYGIININNASIKHIFMTIGVVFIVLGCSANILGRFNLGNNWANQIKIYDEHTLVQKGMYRIVRHPLYSSIMLMFYGACLVYRNIVACAAVTLIFIPFMHYRAKQEETLLIQAFPEYHEYKRKTGMFFPKLTRR